jgi:hypothetical protein
MQVVGTVGGGAHRFDTFVLHGNFFTIHFVSGMCVLIGTPYAVC